MTEQELDIDQWLDGLITPTRCSTCNHPEASHMLNKVLDALIKKRKEGIHIRKIPTQPEIHNLLIDRAKYPGTLTNLKDHLHRCIKSKWEAARYGRLQS